jgi:glycosyltransferase involved in cell wall biosynthesis
LCFPSFAEALPVSWIEAMYTSPWLISAWATDVIDGGVNGFWFIQKIIGNLLQKINILLSNSQMRAEFGMAAREKVLHEFSVSVVRSKVWPFINL